MDCKRFGCQRLYDDELMDLTVLVYDKFLVFLTHTFPGYQIRMCCDRRMIYHYTNNYCNNNCNSMED